MDDGVTWKLVFSPKIALIRGKRVVWNDECRWHHGCLTSTACQRVQNSRSCQGNFRDEFPLWFEWNSSRIKRIVRFRGDERLEKGIWEHRYKWILLYNDRVNCCSWYYESISIGYLKKSYNCRMKYCNGIISMQKKRRDD